MKNFNDKARIYTVAGSICGLLVGSGLATGQEALQYFAAHSWWGIAGLAVSAAILLWTISSLVEWGRCNPARTHEAFEHFCGRYLGTVLKYFVPFFLFAVVVTMISGAGALLNEFNGMPHYVGSVLVSFMIGATAFAGLDRLVKIVGALGPVIIAFLVVIGLLAISTYSEGFVNASLEVKTLAPPKAMDSWALGSLLYTAAIVLGSVPFLVNLGTTAGHRKIAIIGSVVGTLAVSVVLTIMTLALLAAMPLVYDKATPFVSLGISIHSSFGTIFAVVAFLGIYSTASPMIWSVADHLTTSSKKRYKLVVISITILCMICGATLSFGRLVGTIYPIAGYFGLALLAAMAYQQLRTSRTVLPT